MIDPWSWHDDEAHRWQSVPLVITAHLTSAIAVNRGEDLALDGILAYELLMHLTDGRMQDLPAMDDGYTFVRLPLSLRGSTVGRAKASTFRSGQFLHAADLAYRWWWACSSAQFAVAARGTDYWNKRWDTQIGEYLDERVKTIVIEQGRYKAYHQPLPVITTAAIRWHVVGDPEVLTAILREVSHIGKKRGYGYGQVARWDVQPDDRDRSLMDGGLARPVPVDAAAEVVDTRGWAAPPIRTLVAYRAPGWHYLNQAECLVGGTP